MIDTKRELKALSLEDLIELRRECLLDIMIVDPGPEGRRKYNYIKDHLKMLEQLIKHAIDRWKNANHDKEWPVQ